MSPHHLPRPLSRCLSALVCAVWLAGCGGGGGNNPAPGSPSAAAPSAPASAAQGPARLEGVVAVGAPLGNASVTVLDASGAVLATATSSATEGRYSISLGSTPTGPLMLQARGIDAAGMPQLLHAAVPTTSATMVAHLTPMSDAVLALALGQAPKVVFAAAKTSAGTLALLANAPAAQAFLKTLLKNQLSDAKITDATKLDLLADSSFVANKGSHDMVLEGARVAYGRSTAGKDQLLLANKLLVAQPFEVQVDLPSASAELAKTSGGVPANAIVSTLKITTGTKNLVNVPVMDELAAALNRLIATGPTATAAAANAMISGYTGTDGRTLADLSALVAGWGTANWQLGRFQLVGCADALQTAGDCTLLRVAAPLSSSNGRLQAVFEDVVSYNSKAATNLPKWTLVGNGRGRGFAVNPVSQLNVGADGVAVTSSVDAPNPAIGVQLLVQAQDSAKAQLQTAAVVQTPGGYSLPMAYCGLGTLCLAATGGATSATPTGALADTALLQPSAAWIGSTDGLRGARYSVNQAIAGSATTQYQYLRASLGAEAGGRHPRLDGVGTSAPLGAGTLQGDWVADWTAWAAANPDLRLLQIRCVFSDGSSAPEIIDTPVPPSGATLLSIAAPTLSLSPSTVTLWLTAVDTQGRRLVTQHAAQ